MLLYYVPIVTAQDRTNPSYTGQNKSFIYNARVRLILLTSSFEEIDAITVSG